MSRITGFFIVDTPAQEAIVIHAKVSAGEIPATIGKEIIQKCPPYMMKCKLWQRIRGLKFKKAFGSII